MSIQFNYEVNEENKIKRSEDISVETSDQSSIDLDKEIPDFQLKSRKLRLILNKVTEENAERLVVDLVSDFDYNTKLLQELLKLLFERATSRNFSDLYSSICNSFSMRLKQQNPQIYTAFKQLLKARCELILTLSDPTVVPLTKFVGLLFKLNLIKSSIIYQFLDLTITDSASEVQLEAGCSLIKLVSPYLVSTNSDRIEKLILLLSSINCARYSKKIQFLVMDIMDSKNILLTPVAVSHSNYGTPFKDTKHSVKKSGKGVSFANICEFQPVQSKMMKRILKQGVSEEVKTALREAVFEFMGGKSSLGACREIFQRNHNKESQLINQIFKYALTQYNREQEFIKICEMIIGISEEIAKKEAVETGLTHTVEAIHDIQLDSPMAPQNLVFVINHLHQTGVIENTTYLLGHFNT